MRNITLLLAAALVGVACSDQNPSAPGGKASGSPLSGDVRPTPSGLKVAQGKPTDAIGFTKITTVNGPIATADAGKAAVSSVLCPDGSVVVGGTYRLIYFDAYNGSAPWIFKNDTDGTNGWSVTIENEQPGASMLQYRAIAYCAS